MWIQPGMLDNFQRRDNSNLKFFSFWWSSTAARMRSHPLSSPKWSSYILEKRFEVPLKINPLPTWTTPRKNYLPSKIKVAIEAEDRPICPQGWLFYWLPISMRRAQYCLNGLQLTGKYRKVFEMHHADKGSSQSLLSSCVKK